MVFNSHFDTGVFLWFLKRLVRQIKRTVFLIVDGHPVHHAVKVKKLDSHTYRSNPSFLSSWLQSGTESG